MKAATAAVKASAEARLPTGGESSGRASMVETAEGAGMIAAVKFSSTSSVEPTATIESASSTIESASSTIEAPVRENPAVGCPAVVVEENTMSPPTPVAPTPAKPSKEAKAKTKAEGKSRAGKVKSRIPVPAWPGHEWPSIDEPGIVLGHVNNLRIGGFDRNVLSVLRYFFLFGTV